MVLFAYVANVSYSTEDKLGMPARRTTLGLCERLFYNIFLLQNSLILSRQQFFFQIFLRTASLSFIQIFKYASFLSNYLSFWAK